MMNTETGTGAASSRSRILPFGICLVLLTTSVAAQLRRPLTDYLRLNGTQLDLRGTEVRDDDLATLRGPEFSRVTAVLLARTGIGDLGLTFLRHLHLKELDLYYTRVTDAGLAYLEGLPLERLDLTGTGVTDAGLQYLKNLPLRILVLSNTRVADPALLGRRVPLKVLDLSATRVKDAGLKPLRNSQQLEVLILSDTKITDEGFVYLDQVSRLSRLVLTGTGVTAAGVAQFTAAHPNVHVITEYPTR